MGGVLLRERHHTCAKDDANDGTRNRTSGKNFHNLLFREDPVEIQNAIQNLEIPEDSIREKGI